MSRGRLITDWVWGFMNFLWIWMISMQRERGVIIASSNNNNNFKMIVIYLEIVILLSLSSKYWATAPSHWMTSLLIQSMHHLEWKIYVCAGVGGARFVTFPAKVNSPFVYSQGTHGRWFFFMRGTRHSHSNGNVWDISHIAHSIIRHYGMPFAGVQICRRAK